MPTIPIERGHKFDVELTIVIRRDHWTRNVSGGEYPHPKSNKRYDTRNKADIRPFRVYNLHSFLAFVALNHICLLNIAPFPCSSIYYKGMLYMQVAIFLSPSAFGSGCARGVMDNKTEFKIWKLSSNSSQIRYSHLCADTLKKRHGSFSYTQLTQKGKDSIYFSVICAVNADTIIIGWKVFLSV